MKYISLLKYIAMSVLLGSFTLILYTSCDDNDDYKEQMGENHILSDIKIYTTMDTVPLLVGRDTTFAYTVTPDYATDTTVVWSSGDKTIATVDKSGRIKGLSPGKVYITVAPKVGYATSATIPVRVIDRIVYTQDITITNTDLEVYETDKLQLKTALTPSDVTYYALKWTSSNESVATVSANGIVAGIKEGTATITATSVDGTNVSKSVTITVRPIIPVTDVELDPSMLDIAKYEVAKLLFTVTPSNATASSLVWTCSNKEVATIENGILTAVGAGTTTLTATGTYADGSKVEKAFKITVPEGKVNDTFIYKSLWIPRSGNSVTETKNGKLYVKSVAQDATQYKIQFERSVYTDVNPTIYPLLAFKVNLTGLASSNNPNFVLDVWGGDITGGKYTLNGGHRNNAMERKNAKDGSVIHFVRLNSASGAKFGSSVIEDNKLSTIQHFIFEIWEMKSATSAAPVLEVSWIKTFKTESELQNYLDNE
ncbi:Ig-like domain-containing protein [Dysgonomonas sp. BGC7]|uniref:Ig-like domain-containing protein n=1 Tax=Dysgonomonas sp. BGC7 TaxID=1658008 RepID=UPI000680498C|nr:Ig-like domain-containing protein [Dysgonomonas sp. BGC7]MBD8388944.1 Ig-like domain-containing protein [Dysgonomonas sp. BGC7]